MQLNPVALQPRWGGNAAGGPRVTLRHSYKNLHCGVSSSLLWNTRRRPHHPLPLLHLDSRIKSKRADNGSHDASYLELLDSAILSRPTWDGQMLHVATFYFWLKELRFSMVGGTSRA